MLFALSVSEFRCKDTKFPRQTSRFVPFFSPFNIVTAPKLRIHRRLHALHLQSSVVLQGDGLAALQVGDGQGDGLLGVAHLHRPLVGILGALLHGQRVVRQGHELVGVGAPLGLVFFQRNGGHVDLQAVGGVLEGVVAVGLQAGGEDVDLGQHGAITEGLAADAGHADGDADIGQVAAAVEGRAADGGHAVGDVDSCQGGAVGEGSAADAGHAVGDVDRGQVAATPEGLAANYCYGGNYNSLEIILLPHFGW